jgi:dimethylaniline monooxygenase (N-oxide forming)
MRVAIIGAGFSGITTAKNLRDFGHDVIVYEKCPDIGGVWSSTRRYPGLGTQNNKDTYHFSDMPMPKEFPEWPKSEQVQRYLELYVAKHRLSSVIHLNSEVKSIERPNSGHGWTVSISTSTNSTSALFDHVVVANGTFCEGAIPQFTGLKEYLAAGGRIAHTSDYSQLDSVQGKNVVVIGYGRSACDIANAVSDESSSTTIVARRVFWKLPRKIFNVLNYKYLLLTRLGESLFKYIDPSPMESFLHGPIGKYIRGSLMGSLGSVIQRQLRLVELNLLPVGGFETIAASTISLSTEGFYDKLRKGEKLFIKRDTQINRLYVTPDGQTMAQLSSSSNTEEVKDIKADVIICGTGFHQRAPFLPSEIHDKLTDANGNWIGLYRHILPIGIKDLTFNGYNSSLFCATSSEVAALWIAAYLEGGILNLPSETEQSQKALARFQWLDERAHGKTAHGTNTVPFSLRPIDDMLKDLNLHLSTFDSLMQWLLPVNPSAYSRLNAALKARIEAKHSATLRQKKVL